MGSTTIVLHAPQEREIESVTEVWQMAMEPGKFLLLWNSVPLFQMSLILVNSDFGYYYYSFFILFSSFYRQEFCYIFFLFLSCLF